MRCLPVSLRVAWRHSRGSAPRLLSPSQCATALQEQVPRDFARLELMRRGDPGGQNPRLSDHSLDRTALIRPLSFVPSQHWSRRGPFDTNHALWGGFVIEGSKSRIYHAGDTAYFDGFTEIGKRFPGIDAALLPIGAYDPSWFMEKQH